VQNILLQKDSDIVDLNSPLVEGFKKNHNVLIYGDDYLEPQKIGSDLESNAML
jgi:hypothetical protein